MPYTVKSSEQHRKAASDTETKALLYLMNFHPDQNEIHYFVVDFLMILQAWIVYQKSCGMYSQKGQRTIQQRHLDVNLLLS